MEAFLYKYIIIKCRLQCSIYIQHWALRYKHIDIITVQTYRYSFIHIEFSVMGKSHLHAVQVHFVKQTKSNYPVDKACNFAFRSPPNGGISNFMICLQFLHALNRLRYLFGFLFYFILFGVIGKYKSKY